MLSRRLFIQQLAAAAATASAHVLPRAMASQTLASNQTADKPPERANRENDFFYRPRGGRVGDVIPFYADGRFRVFYLHKSDDRSPRTSWYHVSTQDFMRF